MVFIASVSTSTNEFVCLLMLIPPYRYPPVLCVRPTTSVFVCLSGEMAPTPAPATSSTSSSTSMTEISTTCEAGNVPTFRYSSTGGEVSKGRPCELVLHSANGQHQTSCLRRCRSCQQRTGFLARWLSCLGLGGRRECGEGLAAAAEVDAEKLTEVCEST